MEAIAKFKKRLKKAPIFFVFITLIGLSYGYNEDSNPYRHTQVLDKKGKYVLQWFADWDSHQIYFNVTVQTKGYVGFGLSRKGLMTGADIVMGGVEPSGKPYFSDKHGVGQQPPVRDINQDWTFHSAWESNTHTFLSFSRPFDTCDMQDMSINEDNVISVMWSYGETDNENEYHYQNRGSINFHLLDPDLTPKELVEQTYQNVTAPTLLKRLGDWKVWTIPIRQLVPAEPTTYYCSFHKAPYHTRKQHIVGYRSVLHTELEKRHIHHLILHICHPPEGVSANQMYGRYVGQPADDCYVFPSTQNSRPLPYCIEMRHEWSVGGGPVFLPENAGVPFVNSPNEYYVLQLHYDNPQRLTNLQLKFDLEMYYTDKLREYDAGFMIIGAAMAIPVAPVSIIVPPSETNHQIFGHCASGCTQKMFPEEGISVIASKMHTHLAGIGTRFMYIHDKKEEPLYVDDNYNFNYQVYRTLREEKKIMPGDMIYTRCSFSTRGRENPTVGGFGTTNEMCHGFIYFLKFLQKDVYSICTSEIRAPAYRQFIQIFNSTWSQQAKSHIILTPPSNAGLTLQEAADKLEWNLQSRNQLQRYQQELPHISVCPSFAPYAVTAEIEEERRRLVEAAFRPPTTQVPSPPTTPPNPNGPFDPRREAVSIWEGFERYKRDSLCSKK